MIDWTTRFGRHVNRRFERESIVWLTTTDRQGRPQPRPVWFHWNGVDCLLFSQPQAAKIGHIRLHPCVSLNLNTDPSGDEVAVLLGRARLLRRLPDARRIEAYVRKYGRGLRDLGFTRQSFFEEYCVGIRVDPRQLRGF